MRRALVVAATGALLALVAPASAGELWVIVHPAREAELDREGVAKVFLKQRRFWEDGSVIIPINRGAGSEERRMFDSIVFGDRADQRLSLYWNRAYFRGLLPPATLASDEAVLRLVASDPRAIGYVPAAVADERVRVVLRLPATPPLP